MKLLFKKRCFSWFDSYDIYDEYGRTLYTVKDRWIFGTCMRIYDQNKTEVGRVIPETSTLLPQFEIHIYGKKVGAIKKNFTFFKPSYNIDFMYWHVDGDLVRRNYQILEQNGQTVATVHKQLLKFTDTYTIDVVREEYALGALVMVIAIDIDKWLLPR